jgi:type VI secretion system protein ImpK
MQSAVVEPNIQPGRRARSGNPLAALSAPLLELVLKIKAGAIVPSNEVRPVVDDLLKQLENGGVQLKCHPRQIEAVKFAVVAFIDETVLSPQNNFPLRSEWERKPLQLVYFDVHLAGVKFFEKLNSLMEDMAENVDVVEIYYLCLLLGFKGKYNIHLLEAQLNEVIAGVEGQLRAVGRLTPNALSSHWQATDHPEAPRPPVIPLWVKIGAGVAVALVLTTYLILYILLQREVTLVR